MLLLLLTAGCASFAPDPPVPQPEAVSQPAASQPAASQPVASQPVASQPPAKPVVPATSQPASAATSPPTVRAPAPTARGAKPAAPPVAAPRASAAPPTLDLNALEAQLKATKAIGVFTKISLKNKVDDLMKQFREYYQGKSTLTMTELRRSYDLLMMKVLSLLQDADQKLASAVVSSREAIWGLLSDEKKFAALQS